MEDPLEPLAAWARSGALEACLEKPAVDPDFLGLARELLSDWHGPRCVPVGYTLYTAASDPDAYKELLAGWERLTALAPVSPETDAAFRRLSAESERARAEYWAGLDPSDARVSELRPYDVRAHREVTTRYPGQASERLVRIINETVGGFYGTLAVPLADYYWYHPYLIAARMGTLEQFRAASGWCGPSQKAVRRAAIHSLGTGNAAFALHGLEKVSPEILLAFDAYWEFFYRTGATWDQEVILADETASAIIEFLFLRLTPGEAMAWNDASGATTDAISRKFHSYLDEDYVEHDLLWSYTWRHLYHELEQVIDLELRFTWLGAVHRAPRRP
jgi:hypothetical protein